MGQQGDASMEGTRIAEATRPSVIVVDTDTATIELLQQLFSQELVRFHLFSNVQQALVFIAQQRCDIVLTSANNSELDGVGFMGRVRKAFPDMTGILLGSTEQKMVGLDAIEHGIAQYFISIPCNEEEMRRLIPRIVKSQSELRSQRLKQTLATFKNLPVPEKLQNKLTELLNRHNVSLHEVVPEMEKNPALVSKVLRVANSVNYSTRTPISSLREALIFIGTEYLHTLVSALDLFENIVKGAPNGVRALYESMWENSMRRAMLSKKIAEGWDASVDTSAAHIIGLLQNIGLLVRLCIEPELYLKMAELAKAEKTCLYSAELRVFAATHDELGAAILDRWNFPHEIIFAVANHHGECFGDALTQIGQIADAIDAEGEHEPHDEGIYPLIHQWRSRLTNLLPQQRVEDDPSLSQVA
jgi:HD-like signal output (HDOD) protein